LAGVADHVVLAVDAAKLGTSAVTVGLEWEQVDLLVTELDPADDRLDPYRDLVPIL
jgi:DeoR/GlpR family transcriptional regulator of sugar metabolism